jgi:hypothetical protein
MKLNIHHGMNRADLDRILIALGGRIERLRRTGDITYSHQLLPHRPRANGRRKDAARHLTQFVMQVVRAIDDRAANDESYDPKQRK